MPSRRFVPVLGVLGLAWLSAAAPPLDAQPLPAVCPNGPVNYRPFGVNEFLPTDVGTPMLRHTLSDPSARCNDGTRAVMYIRPATAYYSGPVLPAGSFLPERWVIHFEGGGGCHDADQCWDRWCSTPPDAAAFDRAGKMSTRQAYAAIPGATGITSRNPLASNPFAGYNHVRIMYCSSDNWIGHIDRLGVATSGGATYDIQFHGEDIVNAAFAEMIAGGVTGDPGPRATFYSDALPALNTAEEVLLVGDSAGGGGLRHHADRLRDLILSVAPGARVAALVDAGAAPGLWDPAIVWSASPYLDYRDYLADAVAPAHAFWGTQPSALDQSCQQAGYAAAHNALGTHPDICGDTTYTLLNHITTPFFLRMDIGDPLAREKYATLGLYPSAAAYASALAVQLNSLAASAGGLEPFVRAPRVYGPNCAQHVAVLTNNGFFQHHTAPNGATFEALLWSWLQGLGGGSQVQTDFNPTPVYTPSFCP